LFSLCSLLRLERFFSFRTIAFRTFAVVQRTSERKMKHILRMRIRIMKSMLRGSERRYTVSKVHLYRPAIVKTVHDHPCVTHLLLMSPRVTGSFYDPFVPESRSVCLGPAIGETIGHLTTTHALERNVLIFPVEYGRWDHIHVAIASD